MKKISLLIGAILIVGCSQDNKTALNNQQDVGVKQELFNDNGKSIVELVIKDEFEFLADGGDVTITEMYPLYTAEQITIDYGKNEIRANKLYKNKEFFITGNVAGIEAGMDDKPVVSLKTNSNYGFNSPLLRFIRSDQDKVAELNKGEKVTFLCTGKSEIAGTPILEKCMFLQTIEKQIVDDVLNFKDQDLSGKNSEYKQVIFTYTTMMLGFDKLSNGFEQCSKKDTSCIDKILKTSSNEDIKKAFEDTKKTFPKASASVSQIEKDSK